MIQAIEKKIYTPEEYLESEVISGFLITKKSKQEATLSNKPSKTKEVIAFWKPKKPKENGFYEHDMELIDELLVGTVAILVGGGILVYRLANK